MLKLLLILALFGASRAAAWPVDWVHDVETAREKFVRLPQLDFVEVDDAKVVQAEWLPTDELLLSGVKPGRVLVLLGAAGRVAVWRVRVGGHKVTDAALLTAAQKECPDLELTPLDDVKLTVTVSSDGCRQALQALFQTDAFEARHLALTFDGKQLQRQLQAIVAALKPITGSRVTARYVGAGLVLEGAVSAAEHRKVLWEVFRHSLGRFALDDQLVESSVDAGRP